LGLWAQGGQAGAEGQTGSGASTLGVPTLSREADSVVVAKKVFGTRPHQGAAKGERPGHRPTKRKGGGGAIKGTPGVSEGRREAAQGSAGRTKRGRTRAQGSGGRKDQGRARTTGVIGL